MKRKGSEERSCTNCNGSVEYRPKQMKGSVRDAKSNSIDKYVEPECIAELSRHADMQPKASVLTRISSTSATQDLRALFMTTEQCIKASASSEMVLRQSVREMKKGLMLRKLTICIATRTSASEPGCESQ